MGFLFAFHYFFLKKNADKPVKENFLKGAICSSLAGFTSFCAHSGGTPTSIYLLPLRLRKEIYVGTRIMFFTCINLVKLPFYIHLSKVIKESIFYNAIYILILVASTKLIIDFLYAILF